MRRLLFPVALVAAWLVVARPHPSAQEALPAATSSPEPSPEPTWELRELDGLYGDAFEVSSFVEGASECPQYGAGWWLSGNPEFHARMRELTAQRSRSGPPYELDMYVVHARFVGYVSPPGEYGHLNGYPREVDVVRLIELDDTPSCGMELPDLALKSSAHGWATAPGGTCPASPLAATLELCVVNQGREPARDFALRLSYEGREVTRLRMCGLAAGEVRCLASLPMPVDVVELDADDEVAEGFEHNNWNYVPPTPARPPPTCTPLAPGQPTPTPLPTQAPQPCVGATTTPRPTVTATPDPSWAFLPFVSSTRERLK